MIDRLLSVMTWKYINDARRESLLRLLNDHGSSSIDIERIMIFVYANYRRLKDAALLCTQLLKEEGNGEYIYRKWLSSDYELEEHLGEALGSIPDDQH